MLVALMEELLLQDRIAVRIQTIAFEEHVVPAKLVETLKNVMAGSSPTGIIIAMLNA
ncbi:uncharacterized protein FPRO_16038 [Fusarium proliferatum ET1]|uniref:Uncharacterized protein n=1 Tax=Fusarium proliferatum (strain ET1) TaxID=1227346 RepID=A0A1L7WB50_FUSPR|nr:uncharacterized protein FPRO_16038 [Fusarium proliferatum ET1]CZR49830.1 uncharacterized protein FPRO_16038 [Fusarium proliferatum ET1]